MLNDQLSQLRMQMFGRRSEKTPEEPDDRQLKFVFNEAEAAAGDQPLREETEEEETSWELQASVLSLPLQQQDSFRQDLQHTA
jgi:hypothetical protein